MRSRRENSLPVADKEIGQEEEDRGPREQSVVIPLLRGARHRKSDAFDQHMSSDRGDEVSAPPTNTEKTMAEPPSREEIDAKLEATEARSEARFAQLTGTLDVRFASLDNKLDRLVDTVGRLSAGVDEAKKEGRADNKTTRWTIIVVVVASVIAGLAALWSTQANLLAAFQAGLAVKAMQAEPPPPLPKPQ